MTSDAPSPAPAPHGSSLRTRILGSVVGLVALTLLGSILSLQRIAGVNRQLDSINRVTVPLGRLITQIQSDSDVFRREVERALYSTPPARLAGDVAGPDPAPESPRPIPRWILDLMEGEVARVRELAADRSDWAPDAEERTRFERWAESLGQGLAQVRRLALASQAARVTAAQAGGSAGELQAARARRAEWAQAADEWQQQVEWGAAAFERVERRAFAAAEERVKELRTGLEVILFVVVLLSLLLLWLGERALRPLADLTRLARRIATRGLTKEDKASFPEVPLGRADEVSQLGREFHRMATALLEREKMVEAQAERLREQNRALKRMGELNDRVLRSMDSPLFMLGADWTITGCNAAARRWLTESAPDFAEGPELPEARVLGTAARDWKLLRAVLPPPSAPGEGFAAEAAGRLEAREVDGRWWAGRIDPLPASEESAGAAILLLEDLTEELRLRDRLSRAEQLAAIGRMSAQVAHEVRNPLHAIGLEAEMALEEGGPALPAAARRALGVILQGVERVEKITQNYLRLSRLSSGERTRFDATEALLSVLATYAAPCEAQRVRVDWRREGEGPFWVRADRDLLEQALGNLQRNALQALEGVPEGEREIVWELRQLETGRVLLTVRDTGPGLSEAVKARVFTPFVTTKAQGTGLGLSFVHRALQEQGGEARYAGAGADGRGACFELLIPAAPDGDPEFTHERRPDVVDVAR